MHCRELAEWVIAASSGAAAAAPPTEIADLAVIMVGHQRSRAPVGEDGEQRLDDTLSRGCAATEIKDARVLRGRHALRAASDRDRLACTAWHHAPTTGQRRPLGVGEALLPARELADRVLPRPSGRREALGGIVVKGECSRGIRRSVARRILPKAHRDIASRTRRHRWFDRGRR